MEEKALKKTRNRLMPIRTVVCDKCNGEIKANAFNRHHQACDGRGKRDQALKYDKHPNGNYICPGCIVDISTRGMHHHVRHCEGYKLFVDNKHDELEQWRVEQSTPKTSKPRVWSDEDKARLSKLMSERLLKGYADGSRKQAGGMVSWYKYGDVAVQGSFELRACRILDVMQSAGKIKQWGRCSERFSYFDTVTDKQRTYSPDLFFIDDCDMVIILEIKGFATETDHCKWNQLKTIGRSLEVWMLADLEAHENALGIDANWIKSENVIAYNGVETKTAKEKLASKERGVAQTKARQEMHDARKKQILESQIDFSKWGWVGQVAELISLPHGKINAWMKKHMLEFYNKQCFKKSSHTQGC